MQERDFLRRLQEAGGLESEDEARRLATAVLRALSHLLSESEVRRHFLSQLPGSLKATLLAEPPRGLIMDRNALTQHVAAALDAHAPDGERALRTVYRILKESVAPGQIAEFERHVPRDVAAFLER